MGGTAPDLDGALGQVPRFQNSFCVDRTDNHVDGVLLESLELLEAAYRNQFSIYIKRLETLAFGPARDIGVKAFARFHQRREDLERSAFCGHLNLFYDRAKILFLHRQIAFRTELGSRLCEEQTKKMINLRDRGHGRFTAAARDALFDRNRRRKALDQIDIRLFELLNKLPRVGRHAVEKAALPFREQNIECERRFTRAA